MQNLPTATVSQPASQVSSNTVEYPGLVELLDKIGELDKALKAAHPSMEVLLQNIHRNLSKDPELVHLLKPEQRAVIFQGLQKKTQTKIVADTVKSASSGGGKRKLKDISLEDL